MATDSASCSSAVSPLAYLADLLGYVTKHIKDGPAAITLPGLSAKFHQPFADLPASCACMDRQVSEARLVVDVLRSYLKSKALPVPGSPGQAALTAQERSYRLAAYDTLLRQLGASFDDIRLARTGTATERAALAERLGIAVEKLAALPVDPGLLSESLLERLFGLVESGRDLLSEGAKSGDPQGQLSRWTLDGVAWRHNTDADGAVHLRLKKAGAAFEVTVFRDAARTLQVASGTRNSAAGPVTLTAVARSGLSGSLTIGYTADSNTIAIAAVPAVLAWRFDRLRAQWLQQDATAGGAPIIDPDLMAETDLRYPVLADPAFQLWKTRRDFVAAKLAEIRAAQPSGPTVLARLDAKLTAAKVPPAELQTLAARLAQGQNIAARVEALRLSLAAFSFLLRVRKLAESNTAVLDAEWADVESILVQALKRDEHDRWRSEEQQAQVCLSPDHFLADGDAPPLARWRATPESRRQWLAMLKARADQRNAAVTAFQAAVRAAEEAALPALRDALILASDAEGSDLSTKARWITDHLLIDAQSASGQSKTRVSQAIETVQGLITAIRTGQLGGTHPSLALAADRFDEEWEWLGSYAAWRAAMMVYLRPENLLLPTLRRRQTPAFRALASELRASRRLSPAQARAVAASYEDYFRDVCSLSVETSCLAETRKPDQSGTEALFYQFATGGRTKAIYWSARGPQSAPTFWETLVRPAGFTKLVASIPFAADEDASFIFLFAQVLDKGKPGLAFLRYDLSQRAWDDEWTILELPAERGRHDIVAVQSQNAGEAPCFFIRAPGGMYVRGLDEEGSGWETPGSDDDTTDDWKAFRVPGFATGTSRLCAVLRTADQEPGSYWLCQQVRNKGVVVLKQVGMPAAPKLAPGVVPVDMGGATASFVGAYPRATADEIVVFYRTKQAATRPPRLSKEITYRLIRPGTRGTDRGAAPLAGLQRLVPRYDADIDGERRTAWQRSGERLFGALAVTADALVVKGAVRTAPKVDTLIPIVEDGPGVKQDKRRTDIQAAVTGNASVETNLVPVAEALYFVPLFLAQQLQSRGQFTNALDWFRTIYDYRLPVSLRKIYHGLKLEEAQPGPLPTLVRPADWLLDPLDPHGIAVTRAGAHSRATLMSLIGCFLDFADAEFTRDTPESLPRARTLYLSALALLDTPDLEAPGPQKLTAPLPGPNGDFEVAANGVLAGLRLRAELNLFKLRTGRNIAGLQRQLEPYAAPTDDDAGLPGIGAGGQLVLPGAQALRPTPYRYAVLVERAKQLAQLAAQMEAAMLSAFEKRDAELYNLLKARQDVKLTRAGVRLQDLRVREAEDGVKLAQLQQERAQIQDEYFQGLLDAGLLIKEALALMFLHLSLGVPDSVGATGPSFSPSGKLQTFSGELSTLASYERREQEWRFQQVLASQDIRIGAAQVRLADDHVRIAGQERVIADLQADHAEASLDFLATKFTSAELFDWMSGILEGVYSFFLQQATAVAKLAENQLAFERQETPPALIQTDYWEALDASGPSVADQGSPPDRRGLTGSARLLQDIFRLDQHAFETDKRKLQLTRTLSLARLAPVEFQQFRETGAIVFATPMALFDRDFPGHYLRLVKRVRTSLIALVPPSEGIRATLSTAGASRVTTSGNGTFQTVVVSQGPQSVALSGAQNASGVFELDLQPEMLLPFEGLGVDTVWRLELPKAANPFDYRTIADVLLTIEYTALASPDYRQQVVAALPQTASADRPFSLRYQFADAWYDLHNPDQAAAPMVVRFTTRREDFPPNLDELRIEHVVLYFARRAGQAVEVQNAQLLFTRQGDTNAVGGAASSIDGIISTRRGNAGAWQPMQTRDPVGTWELTLPNTTEMKNHFASDAFDDILFVLTYAGRTPAWPM
jgi:hypothetical protein